MTCAGPDAERDGRARSRRARQRQLTSLRRWGRFADRRTEIWRGRQEADQHQDGGSVLKPKSSSPPTVDVSFRGGEKVDDAERRLNLRMARIPTHQS
jgi:hypothetical protein